MLQNEKLKVSTTTSTTTTTPSPSTYDLPNIPNFKDWIGDVSEQLPFNFSNIKIELMSSQPGILLVLSCQ